MGDSLRGLRIARVSTVPFFLVTQLAGQIEYLARCGANVTVITSWGPELQSFLVDKVSVEQIEIPRSISPVKDVVALFQLIWLFRRNRFDIVHSTTPKAGLLCALAGLFARVPVRLHTFTGQPWISMFGLVRLLAWSADWLIVKLDTRCYADSESQRGFLIAEGLICEEKIGVLGKGSLAGVELRRFDIDRWSESDKVALRRELGLSDCSRIILFAGRVTRDKGVRDLLQAFEMLQKEGYDADLLLVGPQDDERGGAVDLSRLPRVNYVGYTDCPERYMAIADFLCLPSYREGFGTVVIEAAAMGLPTVGTRIYGLTDAIEEGATGLLVPPRDIPALAEAMRTMLDEPDLLARFGRTARARCVEYFDAERVNVLVAEEYARLISRKSFSSCDVA
jgi:glycosyltransferase involved in cell wall biosynthesis